MPEFFYSELFIEILGVVTGLIYLYFSIKQNIWLWPWGIVTSLLYIVVFFQTKFYADMSLQIYYFGISIYGWYFWLRGGDKDKPGLPVIRIRPVGWIFIVLIVLALTLISGFILRDFTDSPLPFWDAFTTAGSVVATWMLARKYLEHWLIWIVVDLVSIGTYISKGLFPTILLFTVYTAMAVYGYFEWKKEFIKNSEN
ncbi:MAG: nicotinamide mononucleotide transporter [Bacteroidales bacterium]|nr:nicotinamide mononucleotide transporter [Bacteroidales bacterium]MCB9013283.1 nicotinamide mononucleotide transporter [Bacteroidales bacterium]